MVTYTFSTYRKRSDFLILLNILMAQKNKNIAININKKSLEVDFKKDEEFKELINAKYEESKSNG